MFISLLEASQRFDIIAASCFDTATAHDIEKPVCSGFTENSEGVFKGRTKWQVYYWLYPEFPNRSERIYGQPQFLEGQLHLSLRTHTWLTVRCKCAEISQPKKRSNKLSFFEVSQRFCWIGQSPFCYGETLGTSTHLSTAFVTVCRLQTLEENGRTFHNPEWNSPTFHVSFFWKTAHTGLSILWWSQDAAVTVFCELDSWLSCQSHFGIPVQLDWEPS